MFFSRPAYDIDLPGRGLLRLGPRTAVMGILNVTPDSFADAGRFVDPGAAVAAAEAMDAAGVDIIDIGGESTRPGAEALTAAEELARVLPVVRRLAGRVGAALSIDTYKADVARAVLDEGVSMVNDISGLRYDRALAEVVAAAGAVLVLMHTRGRSGDMYREAVYDGVAAAVIRELGESIAMATDAGVARDRIVIDPGIGFAKRPEHSFAALTAVPALVAALDRPVLLGPSRKSFLRVALGDREPAGRVWGTAAAVTAGVLCGAHLVRVHDVPEMIDVVRVADAIRASLDVTSHDS
jgi:dihydropteroate synthase